MTLVNEARYFNSPFPKEPSNILLNVSKHSENSRDQVSLNKEVLLYFSFSNILSWFHFFLIFEKEFNAIQDAKQIIKLNLHDHPIRSPGKVS
jgi:hypothetical protein